jgi:FMN phosphatase YigB (HAD superfamily)
MAPSPLICFDLGGVVVRHCRSWREGCAAAGVPFDPATSPDAPEHAAARHDLVTRLVCGALEPEDFVRAVAQLIGGPSREAEVRRVHAHWILGEYEGVADLIGELHGAGTATSCLSNTDAMHWDWMERHSPAFRAIQARHASHLLGMAKPDPRIFAEFAHRVGTDPHDIVLFDDLQPNVDAASRAGWRAYRIDHTSCTATQIRAALPKLGIPLRTQAT